jgi:hypothetical protein
MTRKDYKALATVVGAFRDDMPGNSFALLVWQLGEVFENDNELFDMTRWEEACGLTTEFISNMDPRPSMLDRYPGLANV